jgi:hypothetical protein
MTKRQLKFTLQELKRLDDDTLRRLSLYVNCSLLAELQKENASKTKIKTSKQLCEWTEKLKSVMPKSFTDKFDIEIKPQNPPK